jgi:hypothetical protein
MLTFTRRSICANIGVGLIASLLPSEKEDQASQTFPRTAKSVHKTITIQKLNVVIHGLSAMIISSNINEGITLAFPDINDPQHPDTNHVYWFGTLSDIVGQEFDMIKPISPKATCVLSGLTRGNMPTSKLFLNDIVFSSIPVQTAGLRTFNLPWTDKVNSVTLMKKSDDSPLFKDDCNLGLGNVLNISTIHVLTYDIGDNDDPIITVDGMDSQWHPRPSSVSPMYSNLHVYAEPKFSDSKHARGAFDTLMKLLGKTCLKFLPFSDPHGTVSIPDLNPPTGLSASLDLLHLSDFFRGGETANCVSAIIFR